MPYSKWQHHFIFTNICQTVLYVTLTGVIAVPSLCVCTLQVTHICTWVSSSSLHQIYCKCLDHWCSTFLGCPTSRKSKTYFALFISDFCLLGPSYMHSNEDMCHAYWTLGTSSMIVPGHHKLKSRVFKFHLENISHWEKRQGQKNQHVWQPQLYQDLPFSLLKIGTESTVHSFQCETVLSGRE